MFDRIVAVADMPAPLKERIETRVQVVRAKRFEDRDVDYRKGRGR